MVNCAVIGATGYTGLELTKILLRHPHVNMTHLTTRQKKSIPLQKLIPTLPSDIDLKIESYSFASVKRSTDIVFLCLPHTEAAQTATQFRKAGKVVIDLSADFRLREAKQYKKWYGIKHQYPAFLKKAIYGLPELYRKKIAKSDLIANPGCYPTAAILGIAPLLQKKIVDSSEIIIDAKSGVSGAGKKLNPATQFCEVESNFYAYKVGKHQHTPEIEQALGDAASRRISVTFLTQLLPIHRGILTSIYLKRKKGVTAKQIQAAYQAAYDGEPFVRFLGEGQFPTLKDVQHTNYCDLGFFLDTKSDRVIVITAIDNLIKGAAGQAVQNMNIRAGFSEDEGWK